MPSINRHSPDISHQVVGSGLRWVFQNPVKADSLVPLRERRQLIGIWLERISE
jgi:hypothetical protein